jgi:hypothetical protein
MTTDEYALDLAAERELTAERQAAEAAAYEADAPARAQREARANALWTPADPGADLSLKVTSKTTAEEKVAANAALRRTRAGDKAVALIHALNEGN